MTTYSHSTKFKLQASWNVERDSDRDWLICSNILQLHPKIWLYDDRSLIKTRLDRCLVKTIFRLMIGLESPPCCFSWGSPVGAVQIFPIISTTNITLFLQSITPECRITEKVKSAGPSLGQQWGWETQSVTDLDLSLAKCSIRHRFHLAQLKVTDYNLAQSEHENTETKHMKRLARRVKC